MNIVREVRRQPPLESCKRHVYTVHHGGNQRADPRVLRSDDPDKISLTLWSHAYGLISLYQKRLLVMSEDQFREEYRASFQRILNGLGAESARSDATSIGETR